VNRESELDGPVEACLLIHGFSVMSKIKIKRWISNGFVARLHNFMCEFGLKTE
jgi:hypothetical protein